MHIYIQREIFSLTVIAIAIIIAILYCAQKLRHFEALSKPQGIVLLVLWFVEMMEGQVRDTVKAKYVKNLAPYIGTLAIFLTISNLSGLLGLNPPTMCYSVTFSLALITWVLIQSFAIKEQGIKAYIHSFFEPIVFFLIPNLFGCVAPLISMSLRLFGNILSGSIIMKLLYNATGALTNFLFGLLGFKAVPNFIALFAAPPLHAYFDVFAGFVQMFIFISLTMVFISNELNDDKEV